MLLGFGGGLLVSGEFAVGIGRDREELAAIEFADESPEPSPDKLFEFSYATAVANQPQALPGQAPWA